MTAFRLKTSRGFVVVRRPDDPTGARVRMVYEGDEEAIALVRPHIEMAPTESGALGESCSEEEFVHAITGEWMSRYQPRRLDSDPGPSTATGAGTVIGSDIETLNGDYDIEAAT